MTTTQVSAYLYLVDQAFDGPDWHSLLGNLKPVTEEDWLWVPPGGRRSIRDIIQHVAGAKTMYHNQAFGDRSLRWDHPLVLGEGRLDTLEAATGWLREAHDRLRGAIAQLADDDLADLRGHHSRERVETRWVLMVMMQHDLYHAGEINHIRALRQGDDE